MSFLAFFRRLQWKLTLSYAVVTVGTVIVLATVLVGLAFFAEAQVNTRAYDSFYWSKTAFQDNIPDLVKTPSALQTWLDRVSAEGFVWADFRSYTVRESLDYANTVIPGAPIYILDPDLNLLAAAPFTDSQRLGQPFEAQSLETILAAALIGDKNYVAQSQLQPDGSYTVAFPLRPSDGDPVVAIVIYSVKPFAFATPTNMYIYQTFFIVTTFIMLVVAFPVGAVFGALVTHGLRRRISNLSAAAKAWSAGDLTARPRDTSGDEIGELTRNLNRMAEQLQTLIQTRDELTRVEERNRLARDLHDTVKQQTYAARMQLTAAKNLLPNNPAATAEHLDVALQLNRETQQDLRLIIDELRPAALEGRGIAHALADYAARWHAHTGITVTTAITGDRPLPLTTEQVLYRVLQESLANVARHADADTVSLELHITPEIVHLSISDNGRGFEPSAVPSGSLGLAGMRQRVAEINGLLTIASQPTRGTTITATVGLTRP